MDSGKIKAGEKDDLLSLNLIEIILHAFKCIIHSFHSYLNDLSYKSETSLNSGNKTLTKTPPEVYNLVNEDGL